MVAQSNAILEQERTRHEDVTSTLRFESTKKDELLSQLKEQVRYMEKDVLDLKKQLEQSSSVVEALKKERVEKEVRDMKEILSTFQYQLVSAEPNTSTQIKDEDVKDAE